MKRYPIGLCSILIPILTLTLVLISCASLPKSITYELKNAPFPHPARESGHTYKGEHFSYEEHYADSSILVVIPQAYKPHTDLELMIFIHGWGNSKDKCNKKFDLGKQLEKSGRDMLLVIPEGPKFAKDSFSGKFSDPGGFERFIDELLDNLKSDGVIKKRNIGRIILSGHSGAYHAMAHILKWGGYTDKISDVVIFDGLYAFENIFLQWMLDHDGRFIDIYTENGGTLDNSNILMAKCDSSSIEYFKGETKDMDIIPDERIMFLYSDLGHGEVMHVRENVLKILGSLK